MIIVGKCNATVLELEKNTDYLIKHFRDKVVNIKADMMISFDKMRDDFGYNNPHLTKKINMYTLNKEVEMILQYLMINRIYQHDEFLG